MKRLFTSLLFLSSTFLVKAQDYYSDLNSGTTPILSSDLRKALFSATINAGDNSVKANFFRHYGFCETRRHDNTLSKKHFWGWGINTKAKVENGFSSLFGSGDLAPGFTGGGYLSLSKMSWNRDTIGNEHFQQGAWILSSTVSSSKFQLYNPTAIFESQLSAANFTGKSISLSYVHVFFPGKDNIVAGGSFTCSYISNYSKLDKVEIKNDSIFSNATGGTRIVQQVNDDGYTYGLGQYKEYTNWTFRPNLTYIPGALDYFVAFTVYPSVEFSKQYKPKYNLGFSFAHLKENTPTLSDAALFIEFNDLTNVLEKKDNFLKRSIKVGISTTLNIFGL